MGDALDDDSDDLIYCPECREEIYGEAEHCPHCGHWLVREEGRALVWSPHRPRWMKAIAAILLGLIFLALIVLLIGMLKSL